MADLDLDWQEGARTERRRASLRSLACAWESLAESGLVRDRWVRAEMPGAPARWIDPDTHTRMSLEAAVAVWVLSVRRSSRAKDIAHAHVMGLALLDGLLVRTAGWRAVLPITPASELIGSTLDGRERWQRPDETGEPLLVEHAAAAVRAALAAMDGGAP